MPPRRTMYNVPAGMPASMPPPPMFGSSNYGYPTYPAMNYDGYMQAYLSNYNQTNLLNGIPRRPNESSYDPALHAIFSRYAEDKMRPSFRSIETVLDTISSISNLLETSYSVVYNSIRSVTTLADNLLFVNNQLAELAIWPRLWHSIVYFIHWLLKACGLGKSSLAGMLAANLEKSWQNAFAISSESQAWNEALADVISKNKEKSLTPLFYFIGLVFGLPFIVWRLLGVPGSLPAVNAPSWSKKHGRHFIATASVDYKAASYKELSLYKGQKLYVNPESLEPGTKAVIVSTTDVLPKIGFVPLNTIRISLGN